ncbi:alpha/beta hydrolase [Streptosporangium lutulentum]
MLLLHGYPQTHLIWHHVAPVLARKHTVVLTDLRGYGDSDKPASTPDHGAYSKRAMAYDQLLVMRELGFDRFAVVGHDRGGRVGHRLALDHPRAVTRLAVLDIVPTRHVFRHADTAFGLGHYHWFFLAAGGGIPEHLIGGDPEFWVRARMRGRIAAEPRSIRRPRTSTSAASPIRRPSTPPARTIGPRRASICATTTPTRTRAGG